ncbi:MAG: hypothetical protein ACQERD_06355 [Campylobacterota bacterium]
MSMKENVNYVKSELSNQEKFLESFVKVERFYKKYKFPIFGIIGLIIILLIGYGVNSYVSEQNKIKANIAFEKIMKNPKDEAALKELKETNKKLYEVALYMNDKSKITEVKYLKELSIYNKALNEKDLKLLNELSMQNNFLLKEFAIFNRALLLTKQEKYEEAKTALKLIPKSSKAYELTKLLQHHLIVK